ncbi:MAG: MFS transporter [Deltaproteobacteria bacterium]|nr:MFS transporter [Deltaproteobacteria bacterium]
MNRWSRSAEPQLPRTAGPWPRFWALAAMYVFSMFYRVSTAVIAVDLDQQFGLGPQRLSLLGAAFFYAFALAQLPLGPALDRWGAKRIIVSATCLGAVGSLVFAAGRTWETLLLARVLMGLGMAPVLMGSFKLFSGWFAAGAFGTVSGLMMAVGGLGGLLAASPLAALVAWAGWRASFALFGALTLAGTAVIFLCVEDPPTGTPAAGRPGLTTGLRQVASRRNFWTMAPLALVGYASVASLQGLWAGPYFMESLGYSRQATGTILFALGLTGAGGSALAGYVSDRIVRSRKWVVLAGSLSHALLLVPLLGPGAPRSELGWVLLFAALGLVASGRGLVYAHAKESMPPELAGTAVAAINLFIMFGPALMQQAMGTALAARPGDYPAAFAIPVAALCAGSAIYAFSRDTHPDRREKSGP